MKERTTKDKILDAAERLFAEHGLAATSLRAVIKHAGVNTAAVHYHFGSREGLVEAVLVRRATPVNKERLRLLDEVEARSKGGSLPLESILEAFVAPVVRAKAGCSRTRGVFRQLLGRAITEAEPEHRDMMHRIFGEVIERFTAAFARALPGLPVEELYWRMHFMVGAMALGIAVRNIHPASKDPRDDRLDSELLLRRLVDFLSGGLRGGTVAEGESA
jgi:AcrR family transcriptional regulator